jgi:hypothetical protein
MMSIPTNQKEFIMTQAKKSELTTLIWVVILLIAISLASCRSSKSIIDTHASSSTVQSQHAKSSTNVTQTDTSTITLTIDSMEITSILAPNYAKLLDKSQDKSQLLDGLIPLCQANLSRNTQIRQASDQGSDQIDKHAHNINQANGKLKIYGLHLSASRKAQNGRTNLRTHETAISEVSLDKSCQSKTTQTKSPMDLNITVLFLIILAITALILRKKW